MSNGGVQIGLHKAKKRYFVDLCILCAIMTKHNDRADRYLRIVSKSGTPCYIYDADVIKRQYHRLREALPKCDIFYAMKANPHADVVRYLKNLGAGADVASGGELERAMRTGILAQNISFAGPGKNEDELRMAIGSQIASINVESIQELAAIDEIAKQLGLRANISVRINSNKSLTKAGLRMAGGPKQFGIDEDQLPQFFNLLHKSHHVHFRGIHVFSGSQSLDSRAILDAFNSTLEIAKKVESTIRRPLEIINFGGGFGIPYFTGEKPLALEVFRSFDPQKNFPQARFIIEAGRYLVGPAGVYVTKVLYTKRSRGVQYVITNGGMHHHASAAGQFSGPLRRNYDIRVLNKIDEEPTEIVNIAGPLCTPSDILANDIKLPHIEPGDLICILNSGAYGLTLSPVNFLSHQPPREIFIADGHQ